MPAGRKCAIRAACPRPLRRASSPSPSAGLTATARLARRAPARGIGSRRWRARTPPQRRAAQDRLGSGRAKPWDNEAAALRTGGLARPAQASGTQCQGSEACDRGRRTGRGGNRTVHDADRFHRPRWYPRARTQGLDRRGSGAAIRRLGQDVRDLTGGGLNGRIVPSGTPLAPGCRLGQLCGRVLKRGQWRHRFRGGALRSPCLAGGRAAEPGGGFPPDRAGGRGNLDLAARLRRTAHGHPGCGPVAREGASLGGRAGPFLGRGGAENMGARPARRVGTEVRSVFLAGSSALAENSSAETARQLPGRGPRSVQSVSRAFLAT